MPIESITKSLADKGIKNNLDEAFKNGQLDLKSAQQIYASVEHNLTDYGDKYLERVQNINIQPKGGALATYRPSDRTITINSKYSIGEHQELFNNAIERSAEKIGFHPQNCNTLKSCIDHETGHAFTMDGFTRSGPRVTKEYKNPIEKKYFISAAISKYATYNKKEELAETFALGRNSEISNSTVKSMFDAIEKHIRG
jgi:hypothetical protein